MKKPVYYGIYRRFDSKSEWEFVPAKWESSNVKILSNKVGEYVVVDYKPTFTDVAKNKWYYENVTIAGSKKLVYGMTSDNKIYAPENQVTRAEFVTMIARVLSLPVAKAGTEQYSDSKNNWYSDVTLSAKSAGLLTSLVTNNEFKPNQAMSREEMAYVLANAADYAKIKTNKKIVLKERFKDSSTVSSKYVSSVEQVVSLGLMDGMSATTFEGKGNLTRAQGATILVRLAKLAGYID